MDDVEDFLGEEDGARRASVASHCSDESADRKAAGIGAHFLIRRMKGRDKTALIGSCTRSAVTGEIHIRRLGDFPDYCLVDLFTRRSLMGDVKSYAANPYLFRPVPLAYRTWIYHSFFRDGKSIKKDGSQSLAEQAEDGIISQVLSEPCIDAPVSGGRWSPLACNALMVLATCLTGDIYIVAPGNILILVLYFITWYSNNPARYRYCRLLALPPRLIFVGFLLLQFHADALSVIGVILALLVFFVDLLGDVDTVHTYGYHCSYEIVRSLPNRVFVCKRSGAASLDEDLSPDRAVVSELVSGMGSWDATNALIADMHGILVELRPMEPRDWQGLKRAYDLSMGELLFAGVDAYNEHLPSARALEEEDAKANSVRGPPDVVMMNL
mmetsp:Transcript_34637/g.78309  ORF Transcript_34637/g.78309 Transcript_34637/m.78309 type:complete len:383 (+) Transcript_34637:147-1295(+)